MQSGVQWNQPHMPSRKHGARWTFGGNGRNFIAYWQLSVGCVPLFHKARYHSP
jgi:hypothetical protein